MASAFSSFEKTPETTPIPWNSEGETIETANVERALTDSKPGDLLTFEFEDMPEKLAVLVVARGANSDGPMLHIAPLTTPDTLPHPRGARYQNLLSQIYAKDSDSKPRAAILQKTPEGALKLVMPKKEGKTDSDKTAFFGQSTDGQPVVTIRPHEMATPLTQEDIKKSRAKAERAAQNKNVIKSLESAYEELTKMDRNQVLELLTEMGITAHLDGQRYPDFTPRVSPVHLEETNPTAYACAKLVYSYKNKPELVDETFLNTQMNTLEKFRQMEEISYNDSFDLPELMFWYTVKKRLEQEMATTNVVTRVDPDITLPPARVTRYGFNVTTETVPVPNLDLERRRQALSDLALKTQIAVSSAESMNLVADVLLLGALVSTFGALYLLYATEMPSVYCGISIFGFLASFVIHKDEDTIRLDGKVTEEKMKESWPKEDVEAEFQAIENFVRQVTNTRADQVTTAALRSSI